MTGKLTKVPDVKSVCDTKGLFFFPPPPLGVWTRRGGTLVFYADIMSGLGNKEVRRKQT